MKISILWYKRAQLPYIYHLTLQHKPMACRINNTSSITMMDARARSNANRPMKPVKHGPDMQNMQNMQRHYTQVVSHPTCAHVMMETGCTVLLTLSAVLALANVAVAALTAHSRSVVKGSRQGPPEPSITPLEHRSPFKPAHVRTIDDLLKDKQEF
jgi:hypothetical protein